jgi:predicted DCC family thiol-disulfide oxidoreductase YuxK
VSRIKERLGFTGLQTWFAADPRALGLFRIGLGLLGIADVLRRLPYMETFYTNLGVVPNHHELYGGGGRRFSLLLALSDRPEVTLFFLFALFCLVAFTLGWRTRLFHALSALCIWSIHNRHAITENGGDVVNNLWWLWTFALPLGRRFSIDALRASLRDHPDRGPGALNARPTPDRLPAWSLGVTAVLFQLSVIYFFNTVHKNGSTWKDGTALAWVLEQDRIITPLGAWIRDALPLGFTQALSWGTLVIEGAAPILLLTPIFSVWARRIAIATLVALHGGIILCVDVGYFSHTMMVSYLLLLSARDIDRLRAALRWLAAPATVVHYDSDCGVCTLLARVATRLDRLALLTFHGREEGAPTPPGLTPAQFEAEREHTLFAWCPATSRVYARHQAVGAIVACLPLGRLIAWLFFLPGLGALGRWLYDGFATRRHRVSAWLGMGECGLPALAPAPALPPAPARRTLARLGAVAQNLLVAYGLVCVSTQLLIENAWLRKRVPGYQQPAWARDFVQYGRFFQGWGMFSPDAPRTDGSLVIEATLADGTVVDPQTGQAPDFSPTSYRKIRSNQFWGSYSMRIASGRHTGMRRFLKDWLGRPIQRLKLSPDVRVVSVKVWWIGDRSPPPKSGKAPEPFEKYVIVEGPVAGSTRR